MMPNIRGLIKKYFPFLHSDSDLKIISLKTSICTVFKRKRNFREKLPPSLYAENKNEKKFYVTENCQKYDICRNYLIDDNTFTCKVTNKKY